VGFLTGSSRLAVKEYKKNGMGDLDDNFKYATIMKHENLLD